MNKQESTAAITDFSANGMRLGVFVLAYNAEKLIASTLSRIPECVWREVEVVYVVDDCSTDDTTRAVTQYPETHGKLEIIRNRVNRRYGGNQKFGYQYAIDRGLDAVVMLHGDGQYEPELLPNLFRILVEEHADVVIGSRMMTHLGALRGGMPKYKIVANVGLTAAENLIAGMHLSEFHSGYRGYSTRFLRRIPLWRCSDEWHFDSQILFLAKQAKAKLVEIPIPTHYGDEVCHVNGIAYGLNCLWSVFLYRLHRMGVVHLARYDLMPERTIDRRKFNDPYSSHTLIFNRLKNMPLEGKRVLDVGFGCAAIASRLAPAGAVVDGIEISEEACEENGAIFRRVYRKDLNKPDEIGLEGEYDIILLADTIQYLVSPTDVLSFLKKHLVKGGILIISVPNFVNFTTRLAILFGHMPMGSRGILDAQALHYWSNAEFRILLKRTSWLVRDHAVSGLPVFLIFPFLSRPLFRPLLWTGRALTKLFKGLFGYQNIYVCENPNENELL